VVRHSSPSSCSANTYEMYFPPDWDINPMGEYEIASPIVPAASSAHTMELLAQLRSTGRILDDFASVWMGPFWKRTWT
jgi:hypothetical protein